MKRPIETDTPDRNTLHFVTQPGNVRVKAATFQDAVKQAPAGETVVGIHAADLPSTRGKGGAGLPAAMPMGGKPAMKTTCIRCGVTTDMPFHTCTGEIRRPLLTPKSE